MPKNSALETAAPTARATAPRSLWLLGPALVAGVAYLDPGNVASNMTAVSYTHLTLPTILLV